MLPSLERLQQWYLARCNGDWEHQWGIEIGTLDNPGWTLEIGLMKTRKEHTSLPDTKIERTQDDWIVYGAKEGQFRAACGPQNLSEAITIFLDWFESDQPVAANR